jgi:hypothetical protein
MTAAASWRRMAPDKLGKLGRQRAHQAAVALATACC